MPDEDDRPRDASSAADASWAEVVVPDDISALSGDIEAYHRECRQARRRVRIQRWMDRRGTLPLAIVAFAVVITGLVATLLTVLAPNPVAPPSAVPLATSTAVPGQVGALLPNEVLQGPAGSTPAREIRPALLVLVPVHCNCTSLMTAIARQAYSVDLHVSVVVPAAADPDAAALPQHISDGTVDVYYDRRRTLATAFRATGVTAVLVDRGGVVFDRRPVTLQNVTDLGARLQTLLPTLAQG